MSDESRLPKVGEKIPSTENYFRNKAESLRLTQGKKVVMLKNRNKLVGFGLLGAVLTIYGYTMFSVRQGKLLEAFDKVVE